MTKNKKVHQEPLQGSNVYKDFAPNPSKLAKLLQSKQKLLLWTNNPVSIRVKSCLASLRFSSLLGLGELAGAEIRTHATESTNQAGLQGHLESFHKGTALHQSDTNVLIDIIV